LASGNLDLDSFVTDQRAIWAAERIVGLSEVIRNLGELKSADLLERKEENGSRFYRYRTVFSSRTMFVEFSLDREGKIVGWRIRPY